MDEAKLDQDKLKEAYQRLIKRKFPEGNWPSEKAFLNFYRNENRVPDVMRVFGRYSPPTTDIQRYIIQDHTWIDIAIDVIPRTTQVVMHEETRKELLKNQSIVFILESPHKDEYQYVNRSRLVPISPANGDSGRAFAELTKDKAVYESGIRDRSQSSVHEIFRDHPLIIMNPVRWQTSLHFFHRKAVHKHGPLRNAVWKELWAIIGTASLTERLKEYNPLIVFNCCTGGDTGPMKKAIQATVPESLTCEHPSNWARKVFSAIEQVYAEIEKRLRASPSGS